MKAHFLKLMLSSRTEPMTTTCFFTKHSGMELLLDKAPLMEEESIVWCDVSNRYHSKRIPDFNEDFWDDSSLSGRFDLVIFED